MNMIEQIKGKLNTLSPTMLDIINESESHAEHQNFDSPITHLKIVIASPMLQGKSRVEQHRLINKILEEEFKAIHSISVIIKT